jgi:hypothetical protein
MGGYSVSVCCCSCLPFAVCCFAVGFLFAALSGRHNSSIPSQSKQHAITNIEQDSQLNELIVEMQDFVITQAESQSSTRRSSVSKQLVPRKFD